MKKTLLITMFVSAAAGAALFAGGADDTAVPGRGYGMGFTDGEGVDIVSLTGTVETDSYGNLMIDGGKTNYLLTSVPTLGVTLEEGDAVDGEGFAGNVLYTKDGESYQNFHLTMAKVNGEDYVIDLNGVRSPMGGYYGGMMYGGRGARGGMTGYGDYSRGGMMGYGRDRNGSWAYSDEDGALAWGPMGRGIVPAAGEETTLEGTFELADGFHPALATDDANYLIMMGRWTTADIPEGTRVEATGYAGPSLYTDDGEDYYSLILTSLTVDGEEVDLGYNSMPYGGRMGFSSPMGGRRRR